ncbi:hypothetical protein E2C01_050155 [Portunus trituberculatus]|uniref:Uncharacterized protein n=1 Tax=Portunus trituberculatus TaxID=210409 RepID=A0A5B7GBB0_PORTR|nr:hypothetical protein [Portunus trituberculatus]
MALLCARSCNAQVVLPVEHSPAASSSSSYSIWHSTTSQEVVQFQQTEFLQVSNIHQQAILCTPNTNLNFHWALQLHTVPCNSTGPWLSIFTSSAIDYACGLSCHSPKRTL